MSPKRTLSNSVLLAFISSAPFIPLASAAQYEVRVAEIEIVNDGSNNAIYVRGTFTPAIPCPIQGFFITAADPFQKEIAAMLLSAKVSGSTVAYTHVYCHQNGYGRTNRYVLK